MRRIHILGLVLVAAAGASAIAFACGKSDGSTPAPGPAANTPIDNTPTGNNPVGTTSGNVDEPIKPCPDGFGLPPDQHFAAPGVCASVAAQNLGGLRQLHFAPNGELFGVTKNGKIQRFFDANKDGMFSEDEIVDYANTGGNGNNAHVDGGFLYAGSPNGVKRFTYAPGAANGGAGEDVVVGQPSDGHNFHTVHVYDGHLYVHSGSADNMANTMRPAYDTTRSLVKRFDLASFVSGTPFQWTAGEVVTTGLRNMVGYTKAANGKMFGVVNGMDNVRADNVDVHNDNPGEQIVELGMGKSYGYPFCFTAQNVKMNGVLVTAGTQISNELFNDHDNAWCAANSLQPATFVQAHSAPLDITFFDSQPKGGLPERWRKGAFVALHGSWDREPSTGYKVVWVPFDANGVAPMPTANADGTTTFPYETVFGGGKKGAPKDGAWTWAGVDQGEDPRPVGVAVSPIDGALYVSSDQSGYIYRVAIPN